MKKTLITTLLVPCFSLQSHAAYAYNLNVEIIQVRDDAGLDPSPLVSPSGGSYEYQAQVQEIWDQADIQITFTNSTWDNTEAQRLTLTERNAVYNNTFSSATGDSLPSIGVDTLQVFFVWDHPGTLFDGTVNSGWKNDATFNPATNAQNAGNAQLFIDGTFTASLGRAVMANRGFTVDQLANTFAHEIGHSLGLRHVEDINAGAGAGTVQDPSFMIPTTTPNMMWGGGNGPNYNGTLDNDPNLTVLQENSFINASQVSAAIHNGLLLDADGNGNGVLQAIPEPSALIFSLVGLGAFSLRRKRRK